MRRVKINGFSIGEGEALLLIAGPCVIESEELVLEICGRLKEIVKTRPISFVFKASYDKANRTSISSFRGPGLEKGLEILIKVKEQFNVPVLTDVHCKQEVVPVSKVADIVQIPAFLSRQTDLVVEAGRHARCVNIKKAQFMAPWDMKCVVEKVESTGNENILLTERGTCFGYNRLVVDMCSIPIMKSTGYPVIIDATHSVQLPSGEGGVSGGLREFVPYIARAGIVCGCNGLFLEVHPEPETALSDKTTSIPLDSLPGLLDDVLRLYGIVQKGKSKAEKVD